MAVSSVATVSSTSVLLSGVCKVLSVCCAQAQSNTVAKRMDDKDGKLVFSIELDGTTYDKREDAGKALLGLVGASVRADHPVLVGHYAGFEVTVAYVPLSKVFVAHLVGQATHQSCLRVIITSPEV